MGTLGSFCILASFSTLRGHTAFVKHLFSRSRLVFSTTYIFFINWHFVGGPGYTIIYRYSSVLINTSVCTDLLFDFIHSWRHSRFQNDHWVYLDDTKRLFQVYK